MLKSPSFWIAVSIAAIAIFYFAERHYAGTITEMGATITAKDATIGTVSAERDKLDRDNTRLRAENAQYQASRDEKNYPLKRRAQILAKQLFDFAISLESRTNFNATWSISKSDEWQNRFVPRINVMLKSLDELGEHSDKLQQLNLYSYPNFQDEIVEIQMKNLSDELSKLASGLPDATTE